jgi:hypothetical protein
MRRTVLILLACVILAAVPSVALGLTKTATGTTYYSNIQGFNFTLTDTYASYTSTQWKVSGISLRAHLTGEITVVPVPIMGIAVFWNDHGTIGPVTVTVKSSGVSVYSVTSSDVHTIEPAGTGTHTWSPNVVTKLGSTYGTASVKWKQNILPFAPFPSLSSANPCTMSTATY